MKQKMSLPMDYEPMVKTRLLLEFPKSIGIEPYFVLSSGRPSFSVVDGKTVWDPIKVKLYSSTGPLDVSKKVLKWAKTMEDVNLTLTLIDPVGCVIEKWRMYGCQILSADFGELYMDSEEPQVICLEIKIETAALTV